MNVTQDQFRAALLDSAQAVPEGLLDANHGPAGRRFNVYRNNVAVSLTEAMHQAFPVVTKLLGAQNMDGLAGIFLRQHPPSSPLMMHYGEAFPEFLTGMQQLSHLGYLPDVARLELALRCSYHAADSTPILPEALAIDPEMLMEATIEFAPAMQLVRSEWPIASIWTFNTQDGSPKPQAVAEDVLITRVEFDPEPHVLPSGGAEWIDALMAGKTIGEAHEIAGGLSPGFDLGATLALLLQGGAIITLTTKG
jgi:hypothetical protein